MLRGTTTVFDEQSVMIDVNGLGYQVYVSTPDLRASDSDTFFIAEHITEKSHDLYGFREKSALQVYHKLLSVNGVGPKMGLSILNLGNLSDIIHAIQQGDVAFLTRASGVGKRVAERVVVDLRDKTIAFDSAITVGAQDDEAVEALLALGYDRDDAVVMLKNTEGTTEQRLTQALKGGK